VNRLDHILRFYEILFCLEQRVGGKRLLRDCDGRQRWPKRGVYFFYEDGELRSTSGSGLRVVRVGTHAVSRGSKTTLWRRLSNHRGPLKDGGGNHRGSIFRKLAGGALSAREHNLYCASWGIDTSAPKGVRIYERGLECAVSRYIRQMPFLWVTVDDESSRESIRKYIETNSLALLSNWMKSPGDIVDSASSGWLGNYCNVNKVSSSGLWNSHHVDEDYNPSFLDTLEDLALKTEPI